MGNVRVRECSFLLFEGRLKMKLLVIGGDLNGKRVNRADLANVAAYRIESLNSPSLGGEIEYFVHSSVTKEEFLNNFAA